MPVLEHFAVCVVVHLLVCYCRNWYLDLRYLSSWKNPLDKGVRETQVFAVHEPPSEEDGCLLTYPVYLFCNM